MFFTKKIIKPLALCAALAVIASFSSACGSSVKAEDIDTGDGSVLSYDFDLDPFIKVGQYKGVEITPDPVSVTEDEIDERLNMILQQATEYETVTEGTVKDGDTVNFDYAGSIDGAAFDNGTGQGATTVIGKGYFIEDLEKGMIGHNAGETFTVPVKFPDDYHAENLAGVNAEFEVTINYILLAHTPEATDQWVEENTDASSLAEWRELIKQEIETEKYAQRDADVRDKIWEQVMDSSEVLYWPSGPIAYYHDNYIKYFNDMAQQESQTLEEYLSQYGVTTEQFYEDAQTSANDSVKTDLVFRYICLKENIDVSDSEYFSMVNEYYNGYYYRMFETFEDFEAEYGQETIRLSVLYEKMLDFLYENAVINQ